MGRRRIGREDLRLRVSVELRERVFAAAAAEGSQGAAWVRRLLVAELADPGWRLRESRERMALEAIAVSRATDAEALRVLARLGLRR